MPELEASNMHATQGDDILSAHWNRTRLTYDNFDGTLTWSVDLRTP